jgi:hypothetical protein
MCKVDGKRSCGGGVVRDAEIAGKAMCQVGSDAMGSRGAFVCHTNEDNGLGNSDISDCRSRFDQ